MSELRSRAEDWWRRWEAVGGDVSIIYPHQRKSAGAGKDDPWQWHDHVTPHLTIGPASPIEGFEDDPAVVALANECFDDEALSGEVKAMAYERGNGKPTNDQMLVMADRLESLACVGSLSELRSAADGAAKMLRRATGIPGEVRLTEAMAERS